jgi:hypothetical protein
MAGYFQRLARRSGIGESGRGSRPDAAKPEATPWASPMDFPMAHTRPSVHPGDIPLDSETRHFAGDRSVPAADPQPASTHPASTDPHGPASPDRSTLPPEARGLTLETVLSDLFPTGPSPKPSTMEADPGTIPGPRSAPEATSARPGVTAGWMPGSGPREATDLEEARLSPSTAQHSHSAAANSPEIRSFQTPGYPAHAPKISAGSTSDAGIISTRSEPTTSPFPGPPAGWPPRVDRVAPPVPPIDAPAEAGPRPQAAWEAVPNVAPPPLPVRREREVHVRIGSIAVEIRQPPAPAAPAQPAVRSPAPQALRRGSAEARPGASQPAFNPSRHYLRG